MKFNFIFFLYGKYMPLKTMYKIIQKNKNNLVICGKTIPDISGLQKSTSRHSEE